MAKRWPTHPITRLAWKVDRRIHIEEMERDIRRAVKPLLDALEESHGIMSPQGRICPTLHADMCPKCCLLAIWRAKL